MNRAWAVMGLGLGLVLICVGTCRLSILFWAPFDIGVFFMLMTAMYFILWEREE